MSDWINRLDFSHFWNDDEKSVQEKGKLASKGIKLLMKRVKKNTKSYDDEDYCTLDEIADSFEFIDSVEEFDDWLNDLYNWGDEQTLDSDSKEWVKRKKKCWIKTDYKVKKEKRHVSYCTIP